jgi:hypothetical protein
MPATNGDRVAEWSSISIAVDHAAGESLTWLPVGLAIAGPSFFWPALL